MVSEADRGGDSRLSRAVVSAERQSGGETGAGTRRRNFLLAALSATDHQALDAHLAPVELALNTVQYEPDDAIEWVWFPCTAVLSVVTVMRDGRTVESDTVGREGAVGILAALGRSRATSRTFTQIPGLALRLSASRLRAQAEHSPAFRKLLVHHALANLAQAHQGVACNALHDASARLKRWLLMCQDRTAAPIIRTTQQHLATMVGVQRTTVSSLLAGFVQQGIIATGRSRVEILDRDRLAQGVCECYATIQANYDALIGAAPSAA